MPQSRKIFCWKPKCRIDSNKPKSTSGNTNVQWVRSTDLRLETIKQFVSFFTLKYHTKKEIGNCDIYIQRLFTKLSKTDISILLNHHNKKHMISNLRESSPNIYTFYRAQPFVDGFCPLSHCIRNIGTCWKHNYKTNEYQIYLMSKWLKTIKILIQHNQNPFQCIHCQQQLNVYDQYCRCTHASSSHSLLHHTPFKEIFKYFRDDLSTEKHRQKWANIHQTLYQLLEWILNHYNMELPLIRLSFGSIFIGLTPPYGDYEDKVMEQGGFHTVLPTFPSYDILYNLLSIPQVVPFVFVARNQASNTCTNECNVLTSDSGMKLWNDCKVYQFVKQCPGRAFEIAKKYSKTLSKYSDYHHYELELGFGSFYEDLVQYLAYSEPLLVEELCKYATQYELYDIKSKQTNFWWKTLRIDDHDEVLTDLDGSSVKHWFIFCGNPDQRIAFLQQFCLQNPYKKGIIFCKNNAQSKDICSTLRDLKLFAPRVVRSRYGKAVKAPNSDYLILYEKGSVDLTSKGYECDVLVNFESDSVASYHLKMDLVHEYQIKHVVSLIYETQQQVQLYQTIEKEYGIDLTELPSDLEEAFFGGPRCIQAETTPTYIQMTATEVKQKLNNYDHNVCGLQDDFPIQWSIPLLFTIRSIYYNSISNAIACIESNVSRCIVSIVLEMAYCDDILYDRYFGGYSFLCNMDHVQKSISIMKQQIKHRTNQHVIDSWVTAFKSTKSQFNHKYFKCIHWVWNEHEMNKMRQHKINAKNRETQQYYVNITQENNKFDALVDILSQDSAKSCTVNIVCEYNENAEKLLTDLSVNQDVEFRFGPSNGLKPHQQIWSMRTWSHNNLITYYKAHVCEWKHERSDLLILYDLPLDIDEYIAQINGYTSVCALVTDEELKQQCNVYKDEYKLNVREIESKDVLKQVIDRQRTVISNDNNCYIDVGDKERTLMDLCENAVNDKTIVFVNSPRRVHWLHDKLKSIKSFKDWIICDSNTVQQFEAVPSSKKAILIVSEAYCNPFGIYAKFVINYDLPNNRNAFVKRISYGKWSINFYTYDDAHFWGEIVSFCGKQLKQISTNSVLF
eukprot:34494_1